LSAVGDIGIAESVVILVSFAQRSLVVDRALAKPTVVTMTTTTVAMAIARLGRVRSGSCSVGEDRVRVGRSLLRMSTDRVEAMTS
jgi:hypothetical protein